MRIITLVVALLLMSSACDNAKSGSPTAQAPQDSKTTTQAKTDAHEHHHSGHDHAQGASSKKSGDPGAKQDQAGEGLSEQKHFSVRYAPKPNPIPFQELFEVDLEVFRPGTTTPYEGVKLDEVRAVMPAHKHGMNVQPEITEAGPGRFTIKGMKFHMRGKGEHGHWVFEFVLRDGATIDTAKFGVQCCAN